MKKLAVLIDADNASHKTIDLVLQEIAKYGTPVVKRVYGDWSGNIDENGKLINRLHVWRDVSLSHAITPVQQFAYTKSKDATDMMLIINAMDLLHNNHLDGFCIVSSDSDFTPLASRIRESSLTVYGFGTTQTPKAFINACDQFIYIENLANGGSEDDNNEWSDDKENLSKLTKTKDDDAVDKKTPSKENPKNSSANIVPKTTATPNPEIKIDSSTLQLIYKSIKDIADDDGWANLSKLGNHLVTIKPDFDTRTYGRAKLSGLLQALDLFEIKLEGSQKFVRKRKSFAGFLKYVDEVIKNRYGTNQFIRIDILAKRIRYDFYVRATEYGFDSVEDMLKSINSKHFELNDDKTYICLLK